jgi:branched-chain amino acid transport system substrate-binding protein
MDRRKFLWIGASLTAALTIGLSGCNGGSTSGGTTGTGTTGTEPANTGGTAARPMPTADGPVASGDTIKIGLIGSLTGDQKPWGEDSVKGAQMAVEEFNAAGGLNGKQVELLIGDSASKAEQAKSAAEKLMSDGAIAIVGEVASGHTIQIAKSAFEKGVPVVAIGATRTDLTNEGGHVFRVCYTDDFQGPVMAKFAYDKLGLRNIGVMTDNKQPYSQGLSKSFSDTFVALGGKIAGEVFYESGQTQFSGQLTELKAKQPDGVFLSGYFTEVGPIAQQARQAGLEKVPFLGGDGWDSPQLLTSGGDAILGSYFCNHYNNADNRPQVLDFLKKWRAKNDGKDPGTTMAALGYDAMALTLDALKRAEQPGGKAIIAALEGTSNFAGVSGDITLTGMNGNPAKRAIVVEVSKPDAQGNWQKFAIDYTPEQIQTK